MRETQTGLAKSNPSFLASVAHNPRERTFNNHKLARNTVRRTSKANKIEIIDSRHS